MAFSSSVVWVKCFYVVELSFVFFSFQKRPLLMPVIILHFCKTFRLGLFSTLGVRPAASAWPDHIFPEGLELSKMVKNSGPLGD